MNREYQYACETWQIQDFIDDILDYADKHPRFDRDFIDDIDDYYDRHGDLTIDQRIALGKIYEKFRIAEWKKKRKT